MSAETRTRWTRVARGGAAASRAVTRRDDREVGGDASRRSQNHVFALAHGVCSPRRLVERRGEMTRRARGFDGSDRKRGGAYLDSRDDDARGGSDGLGLDARRAAAPAARGVDRHDRRGWLTGAAPVVSSVLTDASHSLQPLSGQTPSRVYFSGNTDSECPHSREVRFAPSCSNPSATSGNAAVVTSPHLAVR